MINKQGNVAQSVFKNDIGYKKDLPFLMVDADKSSQFHHLCDCEDGGVVYEPETHSLIKCDKILCVNSMDTDIGTFQEGIIQCGISYRLEQLFYHSTENRWCKSKYPNDMEMESQYLYNSLIKQGSDNEEAIKIMNYYDPQVRAYPFWGDIMSQIYKIPQYIQFQDRKLLNFKQDPRSFKDLQGELKQVFAGIRQCTYTDGDEKKNCQNKIGMYVYCVLYMILTMEH